MLKIIQIMELKEGDIVWLKSDPNAIFTLGKFLTVDGVQHARVFWYDHASKDVKVQNVPISVLQH